MAPHPDTWMRVDKTGLFCIPGSFYVDPARPTDRAVITHAHADHARPGNYSVLATEETIELMKVRYGKGAGTVLDSLPLGEARRIGDVTVTLLPAGHVLGSAMVLIEYQGSRILISGDYKLRDDRTCTPAQLVEADVFVTEATFGLPVFVHPDPAEEIAKLLTSVAAFPERCHLVGSYALGKTQRMMGLLRQSGYDAPIYVHGALVGLTRVYERFGNDFGDIRQVMDADKPQMAGKIIIAPPSALNDRWSRRLPEPITCMASGWMRVRARARQRSAELPLIISDHCDWPELLESIETVGAPEVWVTHGREDALVRQCELMGLRARALRLIGREEEETEPTSEAEPAE